MKFEEAEKILRQIMYSFADACVSKAMARVKQYPERSLTPYDSFTSEFLEKRLLEEVQEYVDSKDYRELTDIGNFACWLWYGDHRSLSRTAKEVE